MINLYDSRETNFNHNGIVVLSDAMSCPVTEELNGSYELALEYPIDTRGKWQHLVEGNIIKADGQLFRIYRKVKVLNSIKVNARHIFFDLLDNFLEDVRPTNLSGSAALDWILTHTQYPHPFINMSDVGGYDTRYFIRKNLVEAILGDEGIIATWGGELVRDNFTIKLLEARGLDRGVLIAYGKNIQGIEETLDADGMCTRLMPIGRDRLLLPEKYIDSPYIDNYPHPKIKTQEFDIGPDETMGITEEMAIELLREAATNYMQNGKIDVPYFNYRIDFLELSKTVEYKNYAPLERVYLGDTVTIRHSRLNIDLKAKVIKITKNVLTNRLEKVELGSFRPNIAKSINNAIQDVKKDITQTRTSFQKAVDSVTALLTSAMGGYVVKKPGEILIMDTEDEMTATKVWRWNLNGLGFSGTGIAGPYETAITMDGHIVANFVSGMLGEFVELRANQIILGDEGETISDEVLGGGLVKKDAGYNNTYITDDGIKVKDLIGGEVVEVGGLGSGRYGMRVKNSAGSEVTVVGKIADGMYGIRSTHSDGSYTQLTEEGFKRYILSSNYTYQYDTFTYVGTSEGLSNQFIYTEEWDKYNNNIDPALQIAVWEKGKAVILPSHYRGKSFKAFACLSSFFDTNFSDPTLHFFGAPAVRCEVSEIDPGDAMLGRDAIVYVRAYWRQGGYEVLEDPEDEGDYDNINFQWYKGLSFLLTVII